MDRDGSRGPEDLPESVSLEQVLSMERELTMEPSSWEFDSTWSSDSAAPERADRWDDSRRPEIGESMAKRENPEPADDSEARPAAASNQESAAGSSGDGPSAEDSAGGGAGAFGIPRIRKLFKIGEVMAYTGISRQTLHNYTMLGLITEEERTQSGHRLYGEEVFERLARIQSLKAEHSLKEVREILDAEASDSP